MEKYYARVLDKIFYKPGTWNGIRVGVFRNVHGQEELIGDYTRNYPSLFETFFHFRAGGLDLALYSPSYTVTRILALPECVDIGGEEPNAWGFCPVEFFVPTYIEIESVSDGGAPHRYRRNNPSQDVLLPTHTKREYRDPLTGQTRILENHTCAVTPLEYYPFGFVAGCIWGDDSSWKIQYLDLSRAAEGVLQRDERFGYIELPQGIRLCDAIDMADFGSDPEEDYSHQVTIAVRRTFDLRKSNDAGDTQ